MNSPAANPSPYSRWAFALSTALVCATFPLIWLGGLVTSASAGMAVPDWPTTFGYNMFLYPWESWIYGPRPILFEHGHRLLGSLVGMLTIGLAFTLWRTRPAGVKTPADRRLLILGLAAVPLVVLQGVLGGLRVIENKQLLALVHGCVGPAFFAYAVMLGQLTSRRFREAKQTTPREAKQTTLREAAPPDARSQADAGLVRLARLAWITTALAYLQLVLGALVRHTQHMPDDVSAGMFRGFVHFHLFLAAALTLHILLLVVRVLRISPSAATNSPAAGSGFRGPAALLAASIVAQLSLGAATWVVQFGFPQFVSPSLIPADFVVRAQSFGQLAITTAHVAVGSLIFVTALTLAMRATLASRSASTGSTLSGSTPAEGSASFASGLGRREAAAV